MLPRRTYRRKHTGRSDSMKVGATGKVKAVTSDEELKRAIKTSKQRRRGERLKIQREYL